MATSTKPGRRVGRPTTPITKPTDGSKPGRRVGPPTPKPRPKPAKPTPKRGKKKS